MPELNAQRHADRAVSPGNVAQDAALGLGLAAAIVVVEYVARRIVAPSLPTIGAPIVNDMLVAAVAYALLLAAISSADARTPAALWRTLQDVAAWIRTRLGWVGAGLFLGSVLLLMPLDALLWGQVRLPAVVIPASSIQLLTGAAEPLSVVSLLLVNGLVIPLAEERLWRGVIQPRLGRAWGLVPGLLVTAALFSLKHAIVDASLGRLLALLAGGLALGAVATWAERRSGAQHGWHASAASHAIANLVATSLLLAAGQS